MLAKIDASARITETWGMFAAAQCRHEDVKNFTDKLRKTAERSNENQSDDFAKALLAQKRATR